MSQQRDTYNTIKRYAQRPDKKNRQSLDLLKQSTQSLLSCKALQLATLRNLDLVQGGQAVMRIMLGHKQDNVCASHEIDAAALHRAALRAYGIFQSDSLST